jgi:leucyl-tRNA synthetase
MTAILTLYGRTEGADRARCRAAARFLARREGLASGAAAAAAGEPDAEALRAALLSLAGGGRLSFELPGPGDDPGDGSVEVWYTPSRAAAGSVHGGDGADGGDAFPAPVRKKHEKAFRASRGAIFVFPAGEGDERLEVFITDWSPCPVACAVAVHADHPFVAGRETGLPPAFSGRFVRHPLTGDLLPVWVAGWVKPHFGTGAVLVNPAHDGTDLDFARRAGLPVRFGLVPEGFDGSPGTWPEPPVVKTGRSIRTGPYDGLSPDEAAARYFEVLEERGLARSHTDLQAGRWRLATLRSDPGGALAWDAARRRLGRGGEDGGERVRLLPDELLTVAVAAAEAGAPVLVVPAGERDDALLALRLLCFDLAGEPLAPADLQLVQKAQGVPDDLPEEVEDLGLVVGAPLDQVVSIKQQVVDQAAKFLKVHDEIAAAGPAAAGDGPPSKQVLEARRAVDRGDTARAFAAVYKLQKQLAGGGGEGAGDYFVLAHVLAGLEAPEGIDLEAGWSRLDA